jgi:hypothetical protein
MPIVLMVVAGQADGPQSHASNPVAAGYVVFALVAAVLALVVMIFVRTSMRRSPKR